MKNLKIGKRLVIGFACVAILSSVAGIISLYFMKNIAGDYERALVEYGFAQGQVGRVLIVLADSNRSAHDVISYTKAENIDNAKTELETANAKIDGYLEAVKKSLASPQEEQIYQRAEKALKEYLIEREEIVKLGDTVDVAVSTQARQLCIDILDPLYKGVYTDFLALMDLKVDTGTVLDKQLKGLNTMSTAITVAVIIAAFILSLFLGLAIAKGISKPVMLCAERLKALANGDIKSPVPEIHTKDETGDLATATEIIVHGLSTIITDEGQMLEQMAMGNFDVDTKAEQAYIGDFSPLLVSIRKIISSLSGTLDQINESSEQVSSGSEQVSNGAQALSQGATEQASSVEELAATLNDISVHIKDNAGNAKLSSAKVNQVADELEESNSQMQQMIDAMSEITQSSGAIGKIIKTIEDIAFQTNILALNAAVEAARAGQAGKGFAVVADEVRNLASKSAEASKNTSVLIEGSIHSVENGKEIADRTAQSLTSAVEGAKEVKEMVNRISQASHEQATSVEQITQGIDQISSVVQTNSATAQESAAASEELSSQAQLLKSLVSKFKTRRTRSSSSTSMDAPMQSVQNSSDAPQYLEREESAVDRHYMGHGGSSGGAKY